MSDNNERPIIPSSGGIFNDLANQIKLIARLMADPRVSPLLKLMPIGSLLYFLFPDIAPGPIDDAIIIGMGSYLFIELCPQEIVKEHRDTINRTISGEWHDPDKITDENDVIDGEFHE